MITDSFAGPVARQVTVTAARFGLPGSPPDGPAGPVDDADWPLVTQTVQRHRLTGLFAAAVEAGWIPTTSRQRRDVYEFHAGMVATCLRLERDAVRATAELRLAGIDALVLKGPAFARLEYPHQRLRVFGDVDLLVRTVDWQASVSVLESIGYVRAQPTVGTAFERRFGKGATLRNHAGRQLDLHRTLAAGPLGLGIEERDLWAETSSFRINAHELRSLDPTGRFLHACYHAALGKHRMQLSPLRDLAGMATNPERPLNVAEALGRASSWQGEAVVARAVVAAWHLFDLPTSELADWASSYRPSASDERILRTYTDPELGFASHAVLSVRRVPGVRNKAAYAFRAAFPEHGFDAGRHSSRPRRWITALRELRRLARDRAS